MAAPTLDVASATGLLSVARAQAQKGLAYFQCTFSFVPDDRLQWSPGGKARTPQYIAAHVAASTEYIARALAGNPPTEQSMDQIFAWIDEEASQIASREEAVARLDSSLQEFLDALDGISPEAVAQSADLRFYVELPGIHYHMHGGQIDSYQLIWGDEQFHFPSP